jgi:hypothetical protein
MKHLKRAFIPLSAAFAVTLAVVLLLAQSVQADSFIVDTTDDTADAAIDGTCADASGNCSLRAAIEEANNSSGGDAISFDASLNGETISITLGTLALTDDGISIDGDAGTGDGTPDIEVRYVSGSVTAGDGLISIRSSNNRIEGLAVTGSPESGVMISDLAGNPADNNEIVSCWAGLDLTGAARANTDHGVRIYTVVDPPTGTTIQDSVLSGNGQRGLSAQDAVNTLVSNSTFGMDPTGVTARSNGSNGISLFRAMTTTIDSSLLSENGSHGIYIEGATQVTITNNTIGLDASEAAAGNGSAGVYVLQDTTAVHIQGNTIAANDSRGIYLGQNTSDVTIAGNKIGTDSSGTVGLGNGQFSYFGDGIELEDADNVTVGGPDLEDRNIVARSGRAGIIIHGDAADNNTVQNNYIGTDATGVTDLGNGFLGSISDQGAAGIYIYDGADHNTIQDNLISFNYIGIRINGGSQAQYLPPQHNQVLSNTVTRNDQFGITNQTTHRNATYTTPGSGDNLIQGNVISETGLCANCTGTGIYNLGASPSIVNNTIADNEGMGIFNRVYFGADGVDDADDDLLSMPYISGNTISGNQNDGIQSRDTAPRNGATLLPDNTFVNNNLQPHISQQWFVAVEVVSDTETITSGLAVTITRQSGGSACTSGSCTGDDFSSDGGTGGIWGPTGVDYNDVENYGTGVTTWFQVIEYEVSWTGDYVTYTSHLVEVGGDYQGSKYYDFDGITTTEEISGDVNIPFCQPTGILGDPGNSLCRYQIAQIDVFGSFGDGDADDDGIPDEEEGTGDQDGDGIPNYLDDDSDGDGIPDEEEGTGDPDGDGIPNFLDDDSDGDGIPDEEEGTGDPDGDGVPNYLDDDSDGDGIPDEEEGTGDPDGDGVPNYLDDDSDGDGILDEEEGTGDPDGDGIPNYLDDDSDGDGVLDEEEGTGDSDGDGIPDFLDADDDGDGIPTAEEDADGNGDPTDDDADLDGIPNYLDDDSDGDGIPDAVEAGDDPENPVDTDNDGDPDYLDYDSDDDGITDDIEAGPDPENPVDTDGDGDPDYIDTDSDDDGILDDDEYIDGDETGTDAEFCEDRTVNTDGDGDPNCVDNDVDGDGIPNYLDTDSDDDGMLDEDEPTPPTPDPVIPHGTPPIPGWIDPVYRIYLPLVTKDY